MEWLKDDYVAHYGVTRRVNIIIRQLPKSASNTMHDEKACNECMDNSKDTCRNNPANLILNNSAPLEKVDIEAFFSQFNGLDKASIKERCDMMLFDSSDKIAFCEMTCCDAKYVYPYSNKKGSHLGKRAKAYSQIKSVVDKFYTVPSIKLKFDSYKQRIGLFALREKSGSLFSGNDTAEKAMLAMIPQYTMGTGFSSDMGNGFKFVTVKYPEVYRW